MWLDLLRRRPQFRRLYISETISLLGDWMSFVAVAALAAEAPAGQRGMALALVLLARYLPWMAASMFAGTLSDRIDRKQLLVGLHVLQAVLTVGLIGAAWIGHTGLLALILAARSASLAFDAPARGAVMRKTVSTDELPAANALGAATWSTAFAVGMALGGLFSAIDPIVALTLDAATFVLAALLLVGLPKSPPEADLKVSSGVFGAVEALQQRPDLLPLLLVKVPVAVAAGAGLVLVGIIGAEHGGAAAMGVLHGLRGVGTGIGPLLAPWAVARLGERRAWIGAQLVALLGVAGMAVPGLAIPASLVWGTGGGANWMLWAVAFQKDVPDAVYGRLAAVDEIFATLSLALGALIAGALIDGGVPASAVGAALSILGAMVLLATLKVGLRRPVIA